MQRDDELISAIKIRPTYSVSYSRLIKKKRKHLEYANTSNYEPYNDSITDIPPINRKNKGEFSDGHNKSLPSELSRKAQMRIKNSIEWLLLFSEKKTVYSKKEDKKFSFYLNFITLTLPSAQMHSDGFIVHRCLMPFLDWYRRNYSQMYVWKAETQQNGNLHFHITTNSFIHWKTIRKKWNRILASHGYHKKFDDRDDIGANSIDIHSVKNEKETAKYMAKYMTKHGADEKLKPNFKKWQEHYYSDVNPVPYENAEGKMCIGKRKLECRIWACSQPLSNLSIIATDKNSGMDYYETTANLKKMSERIIQADYATVFIHQNLKYLKTSGLVRKSLAEMFAERKFKTQQQKFFTVDSFKN